MTSTEQSYSKKKCTTCSRVRNVTDFYADPRNNDGRSGRCKACTLEAQRTRYERDKRLEPISRRADRPEIEEPEKLEETGQPAQAEPSERERSRKRAREIVEVVYGEDDAPASPAPRIRSKRDEQVQRLEKELAGRDDQIVTLLSMVRELADMLATNVPKIRTR